MASEPPPPPPPPAAEPEDSSEERGTMTEALRQEDEFLEYLMSFPRSEARSSAIPEPTASESKVGLDHLDNLCKLMEQLGELRDQNCKLQRRVQYLEDLRALQDMHRQLKARVRHQSSDDSLNTQDPTVQCKISEEEESLHQIRARARSRSVGPEELPLPPKAKVSKWTRVKEAFRWEKAQLEPVMPQISAPQLPEAKSQDSGIGLGQDPSRGAGALLLQVPSRGMESVSPADSVLSYSAPMSSSSSSEELMDIDLDFAALSEAAELTAGPQRSASAAADSRGVHHTTPRRRSLSPPPDDEATRRSKSLESGGAAAPEEKLDKKASKTPWGKVKNIIQTRRDSLKRRGPPRPGGFSDDEGEEGEVSTTRLQPVRSREPSGDKRGPPILTVTLPSTEELSPSPEHVLRPPHSPQLDERPLPRGLRRAELQGARPKDIYRRQSSLPRPSAAAHLTSGASPPSSRRPSKWTKVKKAFLTSRREEETPGSGSSVSPVSMPCSPHSTAAVPFQFVSTSAAASVAASISQAQAEVQRNYEELQSRLSQEFHKKLGEWERRKSNVGTPVPSNEEEQLSAEFRKKLHEWERIKSAKEDEVHPLPPPPAPTTPAPSPSQPPSSSQYHLSPQFRKRLLEWQIRRAVSGKAGPHEEHELHRVLPEDFAKKLHEWEKIKAGKTSPRLSRKDSRNETSREGPAGGTHDKAKVAHKEKQLQWLEKELGKVEREKRRLEREREKFLEREARLERMRRAMHSPDPSGEQEVLIQTSTGFFRFHGISEQFTKRLYEWEQQRGIAPEASTFALLDPKFRIEPGEEGGPGGGTALVRSKSVGSVADLAGVGGLQATPEIVQSQPSSLSLNDVEALEAELEENRVSSEPRLRTDSLSRARADSRSVPRSRSNSRSAPRRPCLIPAPPPLPPPSLLEGPGAVIVDVEDEVDEVAAALVVIPAVRAETPVWSSVPQLASATACNGGEAADPVESTPILQNVENTLEPGGGAGVQRGDSVRSASSYQLLEENMQLLAELKTKEAICRQLEAEMEQLERKLQDVAATQNRQIERLRQEENDRTDDEEQQPPSGARVARLRRSVMELGARRERLQRQGQALQDSFAVAWQQQAALAQSLVGRARLLRRGVTVQERSPGSEGELRSISPSPGPPSGGEEDGARQDSPDAACPAAMPPAVETPPCAPELTREIRVVEPFREPAVARVEVLSTQLLALAEKLEQAMIARTREIQTLRSELRRGGSGDVAHEEHLQPPPMVEGLPPASLGQVRPSGGSREACTEGGPLQTRAEGRKGCFLPRQSSEELAELPALLTGAVLELQRGLSDLCTAATTPREGETKSPESESSDRAVKSNFTSPPADEATAASGDDESDSGATSATFVLRVGGWKRGPSEPRISTPLQSGSPEVCNTSPVASVTVRPPTFWRRVTVEGSSSNRSPAPPCSSSDSESEEPREHRKPLVRSRTTGSLVRPRVGEDKEPPESPSREEGGPQGVRRCSLRRSKMLSEENREAWRQHQYVTTVPSAAVMTAEAKKLKTRRVSDTHVAYKSQEAKKIPTENSNTEPSSPINVFVPTQRKIFSPIQGKTESIIGYIVSDSSGNIPEKVAEIPVISPWRRRGSTETREEACVVPWRRTRDSQSASPALPRKILAGNFSPESSPRARRLFMDRGESSAPLPPPFPRSPTPNRRASELKAKEAAPSIKMMIAKYNRKMATGQPCSPEAPVSPAWRSPVAERRDLSGVVRTQTERYQEEVRRALQQTTTRWPVGNAVQKSASAGAIRFPSNNNTQQQRDPPPLLKSSSAGAIKSPLIPINKIEKPVAPPIESKGRDNTPPSPLDQSIDLTIQTYRKNPASPRLQSSLRTPQSPCMRALKLKRAREEFLSRGPGSLSVGEAGCRLSQASAGSGSSFEDLLLAEEQGIVKSASAGMINVQASVYKRLAEPRTLEQSKSTADIKPERSRFGLAGLASKLRKVRLRKKERLNTVSQLCRQSLLVDLGDSRNAQVPGETVSQTSSLQKPSTSSAPPSESLSCPSSPIMSHKITWIKKHKHK